MHDRFFLDRMADAVFEVRSGGEVRRYVGGYSDYLGQREPEETPETEEKRSKPAPQLQRAKKLKFSFNEQREYDTIDGDIAALEAELDRCEQEMNACGSDYVRLQEAMNRKAELENRLSEKMERWEYLMELAEKIKNQP